MEDLIAVNVKDKKTKLNEYRKQYYEKNKEKIIQKRNENKDKYYKYVECEICKRNYQKNHKTIHNKTKNHLIASLQKQLKEKEIPIKELNYVEPKSIDFLIQ